VDFGLPTVDINESYQKSMEIMKQKFAEITANLWPALDIVAVRSDNQEVNNCPLGLLSVSFG
jgi:hypothetical protein